MLSRSFRALAAATAAALLLAVTPTAAVAASPVKDPAADVKDTSAKKKEAGDKASKKDAADKASKKDAAAAKKDAADKASKKDAADKGDKASKKDAADKASKKDVADKAAKKDVADKASKKDAADKAAKKDAADKAAKKDVADKADKKAKVAKKIEPADAKKDDGKGPASIGAPNKGRLVGAVKLHASRALKIKERAQAWALPELVKLLQRAAGKVAKKHPRSVMLVGDLSAKRGGAMTGHNSHQTGRDADVGFYIANSKGKPAAMKRFVAFDGAGKSAQVTWAQFDDARNWALVEALLTDKDSPARYIFVSVPLRTRLLAYAAKQNVSKDLRAKAATAMMSPRDADVHDDHFHVRIGCPESMKATCAEESLARPGTAPAPAVAAASGAPAAISGAPAAASPSAASSDPY